MTDHTTPTPTDADLDADLDALEAAARVRMAAGPIEHDDPPAIEWALVANPAAILRLVARCRASATTQGAAPAWSDTPPTVCMLVWLHVPGYPVMLAVRSNERSTDSGGWRVLWCPDVKGMKHCLGYFADVGESGRLAGARWCPAVPPQPPQPATPPEPVQSSRIPAGSPNGWLATFTGKRFWPLDPERGEVCIEDIAHALANICRFGGHCRDFYSVAQHSVLVSQLVPREQALAALIHDAAEAYLGDIPRPVKSQADRERESAVLDVILRRLDIGVTPADCEALKHFDNVALATEMRDFFHDPDNLRSKLPPPADVRVVPVGPREAEAMFLRRWVELASREPTLPCGHPVSAVSSSRDDTSHCTECEREAKAKGGGA